jgi:AcrR family transcriptional regulator
VPTRRAASDATPDGEAGPGFTREQILNEAIDLLEEHGTLGFRLHDLAQRLDVTVSALYYHFRNRDAIVQEAFLEVFLRDTRANLDLLTALARVDVSAPERASLLSALVDRLRSPEAARLRRTRLTALTSLPDDPGNRERLGRVMADVNAATTAAFREGQAAGAMRDDLGAEALALVSRMLLAGMIVWDYDGSVDVSSGEFASVLDSLFAAPGRDGGGVAPPADRS